MHSPDELRARAAHFGKCPTRQAALRLLGSTVIAVGGLAALRARSSARATRLAALHSTPGFQSSATFANGDGLHRIDHGPVSSPVEPAAAGEARAGGSINLYSGPGPDHHILREIVAGCPVNVSNTVQNGFRYVVHEGLAGWVANHSLEWGPTQRTGDDFTTTADLNLRVAPSLGAQVILVIPSGATVAGLDGCANGFRQVSFNGTTGWSALAFLACHDSD